MSEFRDWVDSLPPSEGRIALDWQGDLAIITLNDPRSRNALSPQMMVALADAAQAAQTARAIILKGTGGSFCSGGNLHAVREHLGRPGSGTRFGGFMQATVQVLRQHPLIGVLEGAALGGGAELIAACHYVVAQPTATVGFVHARLGVSPGFGGGYYLMQRVGPQLATQWLKSARVLTALQAQSLGLVDALSADPLRDALNYAQQVSSIPSVVSASSSTFFSEDTWEPLPEVMQAIQEILGAAALPETVALAAELSAFNRLWGGPAHQAALARRA